MKKYNELSEGEQVCVNVVFERATKKRPHNLTNRAMTNLNLEVGKRKVFDYELNPAMYPLLEKEIDKVVKKFDKLRNDTFRAIGHKYRL